MTRTAISMNEKGSLKLSTKRSVHLLLFIPCTYTAIFPVFWRVLWFKKIHSHPLRRRKLKRNPKFDQTKHIFESLDRKCILKIKISTSTQSKFF